MTENMNVDTMYGYLMENRLDVMYLPSPAVSWLWADERPPRTD